MPTSRLRHRASDRIANEAEKALRFAAEHGGWPLGMSDEAAAAIARRDDANDLMGRFGPPSDNLL